MKLILKELIEVENGADIEISQWLVADGAEVTAGEKILEVMIGKASVDIEAPASGRVKFLAQESEIVTSESAIAEIN